MDGIKTVQVIQATVGAESDKIIKTAAYCRVSTDSDDQANSFLTQVKYYTDFINSNDQMRLVDIYADEGITGTCMSKRDDFQRMMQDCKLGKINRILVKSVSRFARNSLECLEAIRQLKDYGVSVIFENDNIDTATMNSEMILYVKSAFAQSEALAGSKRVATAYRMRMENGSFTTYHAPYGYKLEDGKLVVNPEEAQIVKRIFEMFVTGIGKNNIAATLNREGIVGKKHWSSIMVSYILTNEKYIGDSMVQKTYTPQVFPLRNIPNKGELNKYYIKETHEPIIDKDIFEAAQKIIAQRGVVNQNAPKQRVLTRKLICDRCGWCYKYREQNGKAYWICAHNGSAGFECDGPNVQEEKVFTAFVTMFNKLRCFQNEVLESTIINIERIRNTLINKNNDIAEIDSEIARLCEQHNRYLRFKERKIMDEISFIEQTDRLKLKLTELRNKRQTLLTENHFERQVSDIKNLKEILDSSPTAIIHFDEKLFGSIVEEIRVQYDGTLVFVLLGNLKLKEKVEVTRKWQ